jgi:hypothetical protein
MQPSVGFDIGVPAKSYNNAQRAILERVFYTKNSDGKFGAPPQPRPGIFDERCKSFQTKVLRRISRTPPVISRAQFVDLYTGGKWKVYRRAAENLDVRGLRRSDANLKCFTKVEKTNFTEKEDPPPRLISPRSPEYNVELGRYVKKVEHEVYRAIDSVFGETTVMKHHNADQAGQIIQGKWDRFCDPICIPLDASRFDQHVSEQALRYEHNFYKRLFGNDPYLCKLLEWQIQNVGFVNVSDGRIKFRVKGRRCSGDMNTGLGNVILMTAMTFAFVRQFKFDISVINNGDDCNLVLERRYIKQVLPALKPYFREFGFTLKVGEPVDVLEHIEFCQTNPIRVNGHYRMVRDPTLCRDKDDVCVDGVQSEKDWNKQRGNVACCGLALAGDVPVMGAFYRALGRGTELERNMIPKTGMEFLAVGMVQKSSPPDPETRLSFFLAFDYTPDEQRALEQRYDTVTPRWQAPLGNNKTKPRIQPIDRTIHRTNTKKVHRQLKFLL